MFPNWLGYAQGCQKLLPGWLDQIFYGNQLSLSYPILPPTGSWPNEEAFKPKLTQEKKYRNGWARLEIMHYFIKRAKQEKFGRWHWNLIRPGRRSIRNGYFWNRSVLGIREVGNRLFWNGHIRNKAVFLCIVAKRVDICWFSTRECWL